MRFQLRGFALMFMLLDCVCKIEWKTGEIAVVFVNGKNKRLLNTFKM